MKIMKAAIVAAAAMVLCAGAASTAFAQGVGVKGGVLFADLSSDAVKLDKKTGFEGGLFIDGSRDSVVTAQIEFNFLQKKAASGSSDVKLNYVEVPVMARINIGSRATNGAGVYILAGPSFQAKISETVGSSTSSDGFQGFDIGLVGGVGFEAARIGVEGRYTKGFRQVNKTFSSTNELKSQQFAILASIRFR